MYRLLSTLFFPKDGTLLLNECTNAKIDSRGAKSVATREYVRRFVASESVTIGGVTQRISDLAYSDAYIKFIANTNTVATDAQGYADYVVTHSQNVTVGLFYGSMTYNYNGGIFMSPYEIRGATSSAFTIRLYHAKTQGFGLYIYPQQIQVK